MRKVIQAAGRIIRTPEDRGVLVLIDERFMERRIQALLPKWWSSNAPTSTSSLEVRSSVR